MEIHFGLGLNQHPVESAKNRKVLFVLSSALGQSVHIGQERKWVEIVTQPLPVTHVVHISHTRIQFSFFWQLFAPLSRGVSFCCTPEELNGCWMDWNGMEWKAREEQRQPCAIAILNKQYFWPVYSVRVQFITSTAHNGLCGPSSNTIGEKSTRNLYASRVNGSPTHN